MTKKKNPDKREQKRRFKAKQTEEALRWKVAEMVIEGKSYRFIARSVGRSVAYVKYWADRLLLPIGWRRVGGKRKRRYRLRKGARNLISDRRRGPRPGNCPKRRAATERVVETATEHPELGCRKIAEISGAGVSGPTALEIMKAEKVWNGKTHEKRSYKTFCRKDPNDLWQIDFVELADSMYLLSVLDDHSRKSLSWEVVAHATTANTVRILEDTIERYGTPKEILSDHGVQFYAVNGGECEFDRWCAEKGIEHIMGAIRKPTTQGKVERWHRSLRKECRFPCRGASAEEYTEHLKRYVEFYNTVRPHYGIGFKTPDSAYYRVC